jgi:hypothetical protein
MIKFILGWNNILEDVILIANIFHQRTCQMDCFSHVLAHKKFA